MKVVINLVLIAIIAVLSYLLIDSIREPIAFKAEKDKRENAVEAKLSLIRQVQEMYRGVTDEFAPNFDTLQQVLETDSFSLVSVYGDPDDPNFTGEIQYDTSYIMAADSIRSLGINLDSLRYVPYSNGETFDIAADTVTYQSTLVHVVEVGTKINKFMGKYADPRYAKYDDSYDPNKVIKFGDMNKPSLSGNW